MKTLRECNLGDALLNISVQFSPFGKIALYLIWHAMHLIVGIWYSILGLITSVESFLIARGLFKKFNHLDVSKVKYLAVAIDSEEAFQTLKVVNLLRWLASIGVKNVCLYDMQGVLKKKEDVLGSWLNSERLSSDSDNDAMNKQKMHIEFVSFSDGKLAITKAANLLTKHYFNAGIEKKKLTELDLLDVLKEIGYVRPDPDLMLVYGPARCHLGFPAWRIRYTEIVHMGTLKSMKYGALVKSIQRFTAVRQNYGK